MIFVIDNEADIWLHENEILCAIEKFCEELIILYFPNWVVW